MLSKVFWFLVGCLNIPISTAAYLECPANERRLKYFDAIKATCFNRHECSFENQPIKTEDSYSYKECSNTLCNIIKPLD